MNSRAVFLPSLVAAAILGSVAGSALAADVPVKPIYKALCAEEARHANAKEGMRASFDVMVGLLKQKGLGYDEFVLSL